MPQPQGSALTPSTFRSAPVNTASTPGMARTPGAAYDLEQLHAIEPQQ
jgi:hypothetical protein